MPTLIKKRKTISGDDNKNGDNNDNVSGNDNGGGYDGYIWPPGGRLASVCMAALPEIFMQL